MAKYHQHVVEAHNSSGCHDLIMLGDDCSSKIGAFLAEAISCLAKAISWDDDDSIVGMQNQDKRNSLVAAVVVALTSTIN